MGVEIERRFLVKESSWNTTTSKCSRLIQGYLSYDPTIRVRMDITEGTSELTIKGPKNGFSCSEWNYSIPSNEAKVILESHKNELVEKLRYDVTHQGKLWVVDVFTGSNSGLVLAEIELDSQDEKFEIPPWCGKEVTGKSKYSNSNLSRTPYSSW